MYASENFGINLIFVAMDSSLRLNSTDLLSQGCINEPIQRWHRRPIVKVRCIFDNDWRPVRTPDDDVKSSRGWASQEKRDCLNVTS